MYGRLTEVRHWSGSPLVEQTRQQVNYSYDSNPLVPGYSQNAWGRLAAVTFQDENDSTPFSYMYSYNQAGRVTAQHMNYNSDEVSFDAAYTWDTEGRKTGIEYGPNKFQYHYDANGRLGTMEVIEPVDGYATTVALATYGVAGEMTGATNTGNIFCVFSITYTNLLLTPRFPHASLKSDRGCRAPHSRSRNKFDPGQDTLH